jgi:hypothetical protein
MRDNADQWFRRRVDLQESKLSDIKAEFLGEFMPSELERSLDKNSLFSRTQKPSEKVRDYVAAMQKMSTGLTNITPEVLSFLVVRGLRPALKRHVIQQGVNTLEGVMGAARAAELSEEAVVDENETKLDTLMTEIKALGRQLAPQSVSVIDRRSPTPEPRPRRVSFMDRLSVPDNAEQRGSSDSWRGRGRGQVRGRANYPAGSRQAGPSSTTAQPRCARCGRSDCFGDYRCRVVTQRLSCYRCGQEGHLSTVCRRGQRSQRARGFGSRGYRPQ